MTQRKLQELMDWQILMPIPLQQHSSLLSRLSERKIVKMFDSVNQL
jgi:hypothetical protein